MPTRNIYISEANVKLLNEACEYAESLSAAITEALKDFVYKQRNLQSGFSKVELELYESGIKHRVAFYGRKLTRVARSHPEGTRIDTIYLTAKNQIAVATKIQRTVSQRTGTTNQIWSNPETWNRDFWMTGDETLTVYSSEESLKAEDATLAEAYRCTSKDNTCQTLDI